MIKKNKPPSRFREIGLNQFDKIPDLLQKYVYVVNYGRGTNVKRPISVSIPFLMVQAVPTVMELITLLCNYSDAVYQLQARKYNSLAQKLTIEELIKESKASIFALEQIILDESVKATSNLVG